MLYTSHSSLCSDECNGEKKKSNVDQLCPFAQKYCWTRKEQQLIKTFDTPHPVDFHGADLVVPYKIKIKHFHQRINFSIKVAIQQVFFFWVKFGKEKYNMYIRIVKGLLEVLEKQGLRCVVCELVFF